MNNSEAHFAKADAHLERNGSAPNLISKANKESHCPSATAPLFCFEALLSAA